VLRASDLRRALERDFRIGSYGTSYYGDLLGAETCSKARCDLSRGVIADDRTGTITVRLRKPDPEFLSKLALPAAYPVPREVSMTRSARLGVPGTGPYMIQSYRTEGKKNGRLVLVRNPRFRAWSAAAQPAGYPDRIILTYNEARGRQLTAVEQGQADVMNSPARLTESTRSRRATRRKCTSSRSRRRSGSSSTRVSRRSTTWRPGRRSTTRSIAARPSPGSAEAMEPRRPVRSCRQARRDTGRTVRTP